MYNHARKGAVIVHAVACLSTVTAVARAAANTAGAI